MSCPVYSDQSKQWWAVEQATLTGNIRAKVNMSERRETETKRSEEEIEGEREKLKGRSMVGTSLGRWYCLFWGWGVGGYLNKNDFILHYKMFKKSSTGF